MKQSTDTNERWSTKLTERVPLPSNSIPAANPELYTNPPLPFNPELETWEQFRERITSRLQREAQLQRALDRIEGEFDTEYDRIARVEDELRAAIRENIQLRKDEWTYSLLILCLLLVLTGAIVWISQQPTMPIKP